MLFILFYICFECKFSQLSNKKNFQLHSSYGFLAVMRNIHKGINFFVFRSTFLELSPISLAVLLFFFFFFFLVLMKNSTFDKKRKKKKLSSIASIVSS